MLDHCSIFHKGGLVLWSRSFTPAAATLATSSSSPVNSLVREALIEGRTTDNSYIKDNYSIKWTFANDVELIFVVAFQRILQLTYVEDLLAAMKQVFLHLYEPFIATLVASLHARDIPTASPNSEKSDSTWDFAKIFAGWDQVFDKLLRGLEEKVAAERKSRLKNANAGGPAAKPQPPSPPSDDDATTPSKDVEEGHDPQDISRNIEALKNRLKGSGSTRGGARRKQGGSRANTSKGSASNTDSEAPTPKKTKSTKKAQRVWDDSGVAYDAADSESLDYSSGKPTDTAKVDLTQLVDKSSLGKKGGDGLYEIKDWAWGGAAKAGNADDDKEVDEVEEDDIIARALAGTSLSRRQDPSSAAAASAPSTSSRFSTIGSLFSRITGASRVLTKEDLDPILAGMKDHLMAKNVAQEIATNIVEGLGETLIGKKVSGFGGVKSEVRNALQAAITRILTPKTSTDLLLSIRNKRTISAATPSSATPYTLTFVGVNGVGKSTNLSKVAFWLLQNEFKVLIAACDTFRSGAVEQLRVHVRNLGMLLDQDNEGSKGKIELYEKGYGKDAAGIAKEAIAYAKESGFDVVLIDTAGRMQDNEPLMRALAKLVSTNNPDKVIFVGEALVGNEAVDQLSKFDSALKNFSAGGGGKGARGIDGMLVTKWDTVDDKVGAALSMTYVTGQPIFFVGCGQTYTDLRQLRVQHIVNALLSD